jgi:hypothetical protein
MSENREVYHAGEQPLIDEYQTETITEQGERRHLVYRLVGQTKIYYCQAVSIDAAILIARALNIVKDMEGM